MHRIVIIALVLSGCGDTASKLDAPAPRNEATAYATTLVADAACTPLSTARKDKPDTALCDMGDLVALCKVGVGAGSVCNIVADFRKQPPKQEAPKPEPKKPAPKPAATKPAPAKTEPKKK